MSIFLDSKLEKTILGILLLLPIIILIAYLTSIAHGLEYIGGKYFKDSSNIYYQYENSGLNKRIRSIKEADVDTFECLESEISIFNSNRRCSFPYPGYARDKNFGYFGEKIIEYSDGETFEYIGNEYSRDKNFIYHYGKKVNNSDGSVIKVTDRFHIRDGNGNEYRVVSKSCKLGPCSIRSSGDFILY